MFEASFSFLSCCHGLRWAKSPKQKQKKKKKKKKTHGSVDFDACSPTLSFTRQKTATVPERTLTHDHRHPEHKPRRTLFVGAMVMIAPARWSNARQFFRVQFFFEFFPPPVPQTNADHSTHHKVSLPKRRNSGSLRELGVTVDG